MNQKKKTAEPPVPEAFLVRAKTWILRDLGRKLVALLLAGLLFWVYSRKTEKLEAHFNEEVTLELPAGLVCRNSAESLQVSLTITGDKQRVEAFDSAKLRIRGRVDAQKFVAGRPYSLQILRDDVSGLDRYLSVKSITPGKINLNLEEVGAKSVPVKARYEFESDLAADYKINVNFVPQQVTISGPKSLLQSINEIYTDSIPIDGNVTESFDYRVGLRVPNGVRTERDQVDAQVEIVKAYVERTFTSVPLLTVQSAEHTRKFKVSKIVPDSVTVTLRGPKETIGKLTSEEITAVLNINSVKGAGVFEKPVNPLLEKQNFGVSVQSIEPSVAEVTVESE